MNIDTEKFIADFKRLLILQEFGMYAETKMTADFEDRAMSAYRNDFVFALEINTAVSRVIALLYQSLIEDN